MKRLANKTAVVTGASSGIGAETAKRFAQEGMQVVLVARRHERLRRVAQEIQATGGSAVVLTADLTDETERHRVLREVHARLGTPDVLVNAAGLGWYGYGEDMSWRTARQLLQTNIEAVVQLTLGFLAEMRRRGAGHIINIGSISGSLPSQGIAVYGATKSFLDNFTTALHRELKNTGVRLSVIRAGPVKTEFAAAALRHPNGLHVPMEKIGITADQVADRILELIRRPRRVMYVPGWLRVVPWVEMTFGWVIDQIGPQLLRMQRRGLLP